MIPARIEGATRFLGAPKDWDEKRDGSCGTLPIKDYQDEQGEYMLSAWTPTPAELDQLVLGGCVYLWIRGVKHPVVSLSIGAAPDEDME